MIKTCLSSLLFLCSLYYCFGGSIAKSDSMKIEKRNQWKESASNKGCFYVYWGYNHEFFSRSNIHFSGPDYDLTFYNLKAVDRPEKFTFDNYFNPVNLTRPEYNFRGGYFVTAGLHVSFGIDHMKYVMLRNQMAAVSGVVSPAASSKYAGTYLHDTINVAPDMLEFEHTNGLNLVSLEVEYLQPVVNIYKKKIWLKWNFGIGGIWVITKTEISIFGDDVDNRFHLSGYTLEAKTGPRLEFWKWGFLAFEVKGGYMSLPDVLIHNDEPKRADHNFSFVEYYGVAGLQIPINDLVAMQKAKRKRKAEALHPSLNHKDAQPLFFS